MVHPVWVPSPTECTDLEASFALAAVVTVAFDAFGSRTPLVAYATALRRDVSGPLPLQLA